jgi:hypothetical protein
MMNDKDDFMGENGVSMGVYGEFGDGAMGGGGRDLRSIRNVIKKLKIKSCILLY